MWSSLFHSMLSEIPGKAIKEIIEATSILSRLATFSSDESHPLPEKDGS